MAMANLWPSFLLLFVLFTSSRTLSDRDQTTYIVHVAKSLKPDNILSHHHWYSAAVESLPQSQQPAQILYTYDHAVQGFAVRLAPFQAVALRSLPGVLNVVPERIHHVHTTRTPHFLGLQDGFGLWPNSDYADDVIVGMLDTGIWPELRSFSDEGLSEVPSGWKGTCEDTKDFPASLCNKKLIGARSFYKGYEAYRRRPIDESSESKSPRDTEGHGTHTASTAAGSLVHDAGFFQYAKGEARGMATKARIAAYKICWKVGCFDSDILAAMDQAVADRVHVISLSVGSGGYAPRYVDDSIAIGAFGAMQNGVVVSCSAGNSGPGPYTAVNIAPWILTVGASTIDREFPADVVIGDGNVYSGVSLYSGDRLDSSNNYSVVYGGDCGSSYCYTGRLNPSKVAGKIVVCVRGGNARVEKGSAVKMAGGVGMILANTAESGEELIADSHLIPATMVGEAAGSKILSYVRSDPSPVATILFRGTVIGPSPAAPKVAAFSSRGPNYRSPEILKPDVIAPGVNILAGWTGASAPTDLDIDLRRVEFNIISGTSMSCPHVSGLAALLRKAFPKWSPAAIKSALMTTAYNTDNSGKVIMDLATGGESTPFVRGAGHVDPNRALDPGLVYDILETDYIGFLCASGYSKWDIAVFVKDPTGVDCSEFATLGTPGNLNYPSFAVVFEPGREIVNYKRVVTNVGGSADAVYDVKVEGPSFVEIKVSPSKLVFSEEKKSLSYVVTFLSLSDQEPGLASATFGSITWSDGHHVVRSPVAFQWRGGWAASI
ncbi:subtilisin-like protease SBT1.4 [Aristolochia californica]|uniref:subtilisin-like protease SBT1.4 n=1 Tax=Aristolochia californica TaxID=171875 RepID=UPI0035D677A2